MINSEELPVSGEVIKRAKQVAIKMSEKQLVLDSFQFGSDKKSHIWISTDLEKVTPLFSFKSSKVVYYVGLKK